MVYEVTKRILPFFLILMIVIYGFSQAFYLLGNDSNSNFSTMQEAYLYAYSYVTGNGAQYNLTDDDKSNTMIVIEALYVAFTQILLLNLLIAFLSHIYSNIQKKAGAVGSYERCRIIMGQVRLWDAPMGKKWIHYLKKKTDVEDDEKKVADKPITSKTLKNELSSIKSSVVKNLTHKDEFRQLHDKLDSLLEKRDDYDHLLLKDDSQENSDIHATTATNTTFTRSSRSSSTTNKKNKESTGFQLFNNILKVNCHLLNEKFDSKMEAMENSHKEDYQHLHDKLELLLQAVNELNNKK
jgi:hypothetical protein